MAALCILDHGPRSVDPTILLHRYGSFMRRRVILLKCYLYKIPKKKQNES